MGHTTADSSNARIGGTNTTGQVATLPRVSSLCSSCNGGTMVPWHALLPLYALHFSSLNQTCTQLLPAPPLRGITSGGCMPCMW